MHVNQYFKYFCSSNFSIFVRWLNLSGKFSWKKADLLSWSTRYVGQRKKNYWRDDTGRHEKLPVAAATLIARLKQMKDFTIGQVSNDVIEHGDNYYRSRTGQADYNQFSTEGRWIFRFFRRHFCIDHRHNCFPIGRHLPFIASSVRINCLSYFYHGVPFESPSHENLSIRKAVAFPCVEIKIRLARLAFPQLLLITGLPG